ncbi:MAG: AarF/ABC1/UbiB kinase family protein [Planctomycetes bacterium]|nr:AarF/ABC1/UbiB kinase family protein [Planctomycetota bacterium]
MQIRKISRTYKTVRRLSEIVGVLVKFGFTDIVDRIGLGGLLPASKRLVGTTELSSKERAALRMRRVLEELGPTFVKLGQMLSTRPDILPPEMIDELRNLQESVNPLTYETVRKELVEGIGGKLEDIFESVDSEPMASGSLAQVHRARLKDGRKVVVKVRRPGCMEFFEGDIEVLSFVAKLLEDHIEEAKLYRPSGLVEEFAAAVTREMDFLHEATVIENFHKHLDGNYDVVLPEVVWEATSSSVITMSEVEGESLGRALKSNRPPDRRLMRLIIRVFLTQYFEMGLFHADPHPGNLRLCADGRKLGLIDFGAVGMLSGRALTDIALLYVAVSDNEPELAVAVLEEVLTDSLQPLPEGVERELRWLLGYYSGLPAREVEVEKIFAEIVDIARKYHLTLPSEWVLLARSMSILFSLVREIDPDINVLEEVKPYTGKVVGRILSPKKAGKAMEVSAYRTMRLLGDLPRVGRFALRRVLGGKFSLDLRHEGIQGLVSELESASNRLSFSIVIAAVIMGSATIMSSGVGPKWEFLGQIGLENVSLLGMGGFLVAGLMGMALALAIYRSGKL